MSKFATQWNGQHVLIGEVNNDPSLTQPDQAMPIQEILRRFASGLPLDGVRVPMYEGEDAIPLDLAQLDLIDKEEALENARKELDELRTRVSDAVKKRREANVDRIVKKRLQEAEKARQALEAQKQVNK